LQNIKKRGRSYEQKISGDYLDKINSGLEYIKSQTELNVLIIDVSDRDFVKKKILYILKSEENFLVTTFLMKCPVISGVVSSNSSGTNNRPVNFVSYLPSQI
jgi:hypothetical protein